MLSVETPNSPTSLSLNREPSKLVTPTEPVRSGRDILLASNAFKLAPEVRAVKLALELRIRLVTLGMPASKTPNDDIAREPESSPMTFAIDEAAPKPRLKAVALPRFDPRSPSRTSDSEPNAVPTMISDLSWPTRPVAINALPKSAKPCATASNSVELPEPPRTSESSAPASASTAPKAARSPYPSSLTKSENVTPSKRAPVSIAPFSRASRVSPFRPASCVSTNRRAISARITPRALPLVRAISSASCNAVRSSASEARLASSALIYS